MAGRDRPVRVQPSMPSLVPTTVLPPLVVPFLLTLAISFLIGIGLRDYYEGEGKFDTFGTVRTFVFIGMLGFMLYTLPEIGNWAFLLGLVTVVLFLLVYYNDKVRQKKSPGLIGVTIAQLTYAIGPVSIHQPAWFLVLIAVSILFVLHSKGRVRRLTDRLETGEIVTVCKFLAIAAVILPMIPATMPPMEGIAGAMLVGAAGDAAADLAGRGDHHQHLLPRLRAADLPLSAQRACCSPVSSAASTRAPRRCWCWPRSPASAAGATAKPRPRSCWRCR